jgi:hypothetical protein
MVARLRGAKFTVYAGYYEPYDPESSSIADRSLGDVARWLGFRDSVRYTSVLVTERTDIFRRARTEG